MSNYEQSPQDNSSAPEQIPHSGVRGYEKPVNDFDNTKLREAHEQGLLKTPSSPESLLPKTDKKKMGRGKKLGMWLAGGLLAGSAVSAGLAIAINSEEAPNTDPGASAPEVPGADAPNEEPGADLPGNTGPVPGEFSDPNEAGFYGEVPAGFETPIYLTDSEVTTLNEAASLQEQGVTESEVYGQVKDIYNERLVPVMQSAVDAILDNGGSIDGLDFSNVLNDTNTVAQMQELVEPYVQYGKNYEEQIVQLCETLPNEDGSRNFCGPMQASAINLEQDIVWDIKASNVDNTEGTDEFALTTAMQPRIVNGNQLIVWSDGAIRY